MPKNIDYFLDPVKLIKHYKSCRLNQSKSKVNGYGLAEVWCFVTEKTKLEGAHNSLVDTFAQCEILHDDRLLPFLDKPAGIELSGIGRGTLKTQRADRSIVAKLNGFRANAQRMESSASSATMGTPMALNTRRREFGSGNTREILK